MNFHIQPCQPAPAIATYKVLQTSHTQAFIHTLLRHYCLLNSFYCHNPNTETVSDLNSFKL